MMMMMRKGRSIAKSCGDRISSSQSRDFSCSPALVLASEITCVAAVSFFVGYMAYIVTDYVKCQVYHERVMKLGAEQSALHKQFIETHDNLMKKKRKGLE